MVTLIHTSGIDRLFLHFRCLTCRQYLLNWYNFRNLPSRVKNSISVSAIRHGGAKVTTSLPLTQKINELCLFF